VVWAAFAVLLPLVVRRRWLAMDLLGAALWASGLIAAHVALADLLATTTALDAARGAVAGSIGAAVLVLSVSWMTPPGERWRARPVSTA
jgi:membrane protein DedA with SNARE-associated domain